MFKLSLLILTLLSPSGVTLLDYFNSLGGVRVEYTFTGVTANGDVAIKQEGSAEIQGRCYHLKADGLEVFCDGESSFLYLPKSEELVISKDESSPLLSASDIKKKTDGGTLTATYNGPDGVVYTVNLKKIEPLEAALPESHFVFSGYDNPNLIVTDIR